ncbi:MAG: CRTAC1 family protein [Planctomycetes bacterium]|nr:CRTAC1 family protein [Planctomycetota bacterium]
MRNWIPAVTMVAIAAWTGSWSTHYVSAAIFTNVTAFSGIAYQHAPSSAYTMTGGAVAGDFDGDGWVDLFVTRHGQSDILYLNQRDGTFADVSAAAGFNASFLSSGAAAADIDNDGDLDLYVTTDISKRNYLYINNGAGQFSEQAVARGADVPTEFQRSRFGATFGDYDRDGFVDLYTTAWNAFGPTPGSSPSKLLRNRGAAQPGFFDDATVTAGVALEGGPPSHPNLTADPQYVFAFSPRFSDLDRDGHPDLVIAGDFGTSRLFWNNGDGTFSDGTRSAGVGTEGNGMGSTIGDFNGDGQLDWFVTAIADPGVLHHDGARLFQNNGDRTFSDVTDSAGVRDVGWGWGTAFFDYDNDGDEDLIATNGFPNEFPNDMTRLFENNGDGTFTNISGEGSGVNDTEYGTGLLTFDYDRDGDLDVLIINNNSAPILYRNDSDTGNAWLRVELQGVESNRQGIGALITIDPDVNIVGDEIIREVNAGSHYLTQSETTAHFGLGDLVGTIDQITIQWPLGQQQILHNVDPNQVLLVVEVPEPATAAMLSAIFVCMCCWRRRPCYNAGE